MPFSRGSSWPMDQICVSSSSCTEGRFFTTKLPGKLPNYNGISTKMSHVSWPWSVRESNVSLWFIPTSIWSSVIWTVLLHLHLSPIPTLWFCYPITMYVAFVHAVKQFSDANGVSYNSSQLWHSTWRLHQVPQFEASVLQDANHKSRLLLLTDRT